jgi:hypothetical protein
MLLCGIQTNALQNNAYQLVLPRFPLVQYFATAFAMPEISLDVAMTSTPFVDMPFAGDKPKFQPFVFQFLVNEDMSNYEKIYEWIAKIGFAESHAAYKNFANKGDMQQTLGEQDAKVIVLSNKGNPIRTITFFDAIPISLSGIEFTSQDPDTSYVKASVSMAYTYYKFE